MRYKWPSCTRFMSNIYRHQSVLVVRGKSKKQLFSCIVVKERHIYPLGMVGYGVFLLPLIIQLKSEFPKVKSQWYVDDGSTADILKHITFLKIGCSPFRYLYDIFRIKYLYICVIYSFLLGSVIKVYFFMYREADFFVTSKK